MLYIVESSKTEKTWHVGMPRPEVNRVSSVVEVQADGDELIYIKEQFTHNGVLTLPVPKKSVVNWYGDLAKMIYMALPV